MPFKSKAQQGLFFAKEAKGELPKGTAEKWASETDFSKLPEKVKAPTTKRFSKLRKYLK